MTKLELLNRIQNLSSIIHSTDLEQYHFSEETLQEMKKTLDKITEQFIEAYC
jgi:hypothetical protein